MQRDDELIQVDESYPREGVPRAVCTVIEPVVLSWVLGTWEVAKVDEASLHKRAKRRPGLWDGIWLPVLSQKELVNANVPAHSVCCCSESVQLDSCSRRAGKQCVCLSLRTTYRWYSIHSMTSSGCSSFISAQTATVLGHACDQGLERGVFFFSGLYLQHGLCLKLWLCS